MVIPPHTPPSFQLSIPQKRDLLRDGRYIISLKIARAGINLYLLIYCADLYKLSQDVSSLEIITRGGLKRDLFLFLQRTYEISLEKLLESRCDILEAVTQEISHEIDIDTLN